MGIFSSIFGHKELSENEKFETLRDDGVRAMQMGEFPYAEKCFLAALHIRYDLKTVGFLAETYLRKEDYQSALPLLEKLKCEEDDPLEIEILIAHAQGKLHLYKEENETTKAILEKNANEPRAHYLAAESEHGLGENMEAIVHLAECISSRPDYTQALLLRTRILTEMEQWSEALEDAKMLVEKQPDNETFLFLLAKNQAALGNTEEARSNLERIMQINPFNEETVIFLGSLYEQNSRWDKAISLYSDAIELSPNFTEAYKARSKVKLHLKDEIGAADDLKRATELASVENEEPDGEYTNEQNKINEQIRNNNPFSF